MNGLISGLLSVAIYIWLFIFGWAFNAWITKQGTKLDGFEWLLVVVGNSVTLICIGVLDLLLPDWNAGLIGLTAFSASGLHMAYGAVDRYIELRDRINKLAKDDAKNTLAK